MLVEDEHRRDNQWRTQYHFGRYIHSVDAGININTGVRLDNIIEIDSYAIGNDQFNFGVRHTHRFDHVFDRPAPVKGILNRRVFLRAREKESQALVEVKVGSVHNYSVGTDLGRIVSSILTMVDR